MFEWDDLRAFIAVARTGKLGPAAERLGVDPATVRRRVVRLESALKATLVVRSSAGMTLTATGRQLLEIAVEAESAMEAAMRVTQPDAVSGIVRISTAEGFGSAVLAPALPDLAASRPGLRIELAAQTGFLSPARREVDMAITLSAPQGARLIVEPLTPYQLALYASAGYLERHGAPATLEALDGHQLVGYVDDLLFSAELRYLDEILPGLVPRLASSSITAQRAIVAADGGIGVLPCFLGAGLVRVLPEVAPLERRFWLSTHEEVHPTARGRAVRAWLLELVKTRRELLRPF
jgi:DNA-binding transcriptional LysR family regulator